MKFLLLLVPNHFRKLRLQPARRFCIQVTIESCFLCGVSFALLSMFELESNQEAFFIDWPGFVFVFVIIGLALPILETIIFQIVPIIIARRCGLRFHWQVILSTFLFALAHFRLGIAAGISVGIIGGFYFALTYAHWLEKSAWIAFWTTCLSHVIRNCFCLAALGLLLWLAPEELPQRLP